MLSLFSVKNFRNFSKRFEFSLNSRKQYEFNTEAVQHGTVNHAMIYGINGSGKSNLGLAVIDLTHHLLDEAQDSNSLQRNYLSGSCSDSEFAEFSYTFIFGNDTVKYSYAKSSPKEVIKEQLQVNDNILAQIDRTQSDIATYNVSGAEHLKKDLKNTKISIIKYLLANTVLDETKENQLLLHMIDFVKGMVFFRSINSDPRGEFFGKTLNVERLSKSIIQNNAVDDFEHFLNEAGVSCKLCLIPYSNNEKVIGFDFGNKKIEFGVAASTGTIALGVFYFWWLRLKKGEIKFAYIDEFDAFYHHRLAKLIVRKISATSCQTILTTHNTGVMSNDLLRPDCYFELSNSLDSLASMTNKELRKAHNIEKIYKGMTG